jgi:hypothetical protein
VAVVHRISVIGHLLDAMRLGKNGAQNDYALDVTNWTPVFGSLPPVPGDPNPAPFFMGVSGGLR